MFPRAMLAVAYATGRAPHARQAKGDEPDKKGYPSPPGWGFGVGLTTPSSKKAYCYESRAKEKHCSTGQSPQWAVVPMEEEEEEEEKKKKKKQKKEKKKKKKKLEEENKQI